MAIRQTLWTLAAICTCVVLSVSVLGVDGRAVTGGRRRTRRPTAQPPQSEDPWMLNRGVCPPVLCGPEAGSVVGRDDDRSSNTRRAPSPSPSPGSDPDVMSEPLRVGGRLQHNAGSNFPFFEGDIVLDTQMSNRLTRAKARSLGKGKSRRKGRSRSRSRSRDSTSRSRDSTSRSRDSTSRSRGRRSIVRPVSRLWEYGIIPYVIDDSLSGKTKSYIKRSMAHIENVTCITFILRNESTDPDFLHFINQPGCWSYVGRRGGEQYVSLGYGCSYYGTALHETIHAIGFWHEQSRLDRDSYIEIVKANLSPSAIDQFGVRQKTESTSRGFAYDYDSIMHYGTHYFSSNGKATLKVIGIGKTLGLKIGQRKRLSDLDVAQLRDMYHCNEKDDERKSCKPGWKKFNSSCYLFVTSPRHEYGRAERECRTQGSHLVSIESAEEDEYIKDTLIRSFKNHKVWRTGGRLRGTEWVWYDRTERHQMAFNYTSWAPNHPGSYSTLVLARYDGRPPRFVWRGMWSGTEPQAKNSSHSYICEMHRKEECVVSRRHGRNYRGTLSYTRQGASCQRWTSQYPHTHRYLKGSRKTMDEDRHGLGDHNYCRNPDSPKRKRPWCFTNLAERRWQYCDVQVVDTTCDNTLVPQSSARAQRRTQARTSDN